ncbi:His/Gly/Thr/Pro-type tRNA ligase C-terminal domain-containing protein, partial [Ilyobacter sp.]|uniref:His/Gly/Thr/Pro-type tRNA ligase C-terminal domain-containing protein n=1 Tax=Ilyobacter sp. TaxID=3100343 RepID=UPI003563A0F0
QVALGEKVYTELLEAGIDTVLDDRNERPGFKFKDVDLIGFPFKVVSGKQAEEGILEIKIRRTGETMDVKAEDVVTTIKELMKKY